MICVSASSGAAAKMSVEIDRVDQHVEREDPEQEAEVADPVDDEGLDRRRARALLAIVEADQQVRGDAHALPAEEQLQEVVGGDQRQHREGEERQVGEEPRLVALAVLEVLVVVHVAEAVEVHERRHRGHHHQHDRRQPVEPARPSPTPASPRRSSGTADGCCVTPSKLKKTIQASRQARNSSAGRRDQRPLLGEPAIAEAAEHGAEQRREEDDRDHRGVSPSSR